MKINNNYVEIAVSKIENYTIEDLDILERLQVIYRLFGNTLNNIAPYMIDGEEDEKAVEKLNKIYKEIEEIIKGE